ncbi:pyridoxamine 5'-phosphate oxidase family protein [Methanolapillus africanus]
MKMNQMTESEITEFLEKAPVGRIATQNENGFPYIAPIHFVYYNQKIYIHGLPKGQKIDNILAHPKVGFEIDQMDGLNISAERKAACGIGTYYSSVIILGNAKMVDDADLKDKVLRLTVEKYVPDYPKIPFGVMIEKTGIIEIEIVECTGKRRK